MEQSDAKKGSHDGQPGVSVVVPFYNRAGLVPDVVAALRRQDPSVEIVIADDGSTDGTETAAAGLPVKYVRQENRGPAAARNRGWRSAAGEIIAFLDSDCIARPGWVGELLRGFDADGVGAVAGSYDIANPDRLLARLIHEEIRWRHSKFGAFVRAFGSYNVAIRRAVLERTGGFDESYRTASGEDNDLSFRILKAGCRIRFMPGALVAHFHTESLWRYLREQYRHGYWRMKLYRDHRDMMKGDDYTGVKDVIEPPLAFLAAAGSPLLATTYWPYEAAFIAALFLLGVPVAAAVSLRRGSPELLLIAPLGFARAFARMYGMVRGVMRFWFGSS